jgi:hypothetical protein
MCYEQLAPNILTSIKVHTENNTTDTTTKALEGSALEHIDKILFAKPFHLEHDINLHRMKISFHTIDRT